jgi:steroid delta-isomerase-like uncharacterized protein
MADLKSVMQSIYDGFNARDYDAIEAQLADDFKEHEEMPGMPSDKTAPRAFMTMFTAAFSDLTMHVEDMLQDRDKVAARGRMTGTHDGEFMGMPATGKTFDIAFLDIIEFRDDKAIGHWGLNDVAGMMEQLGLGG